ncbi:hypothetical protein FACS1894211_04550 [Clostridia bacterium]|nr:hypothetical protein FACS1894211_04550 [Clostridia bacterium]
MDCKKSESVDAYIAGASTDRHEMLQGLRSLIFEAAPDAVEGIGQRMPSYKLYGKQFAYFFNGKNHISIFIDSKIVENNKDRLKGYVLCSSGFQMKLDEPLPIDLIREFLMLKAEMIKRADKKR